MDPKSLPDGGPAFPTENAQQVGHQTWRYEGMTMRDYFAAKVLQSYMTRSDADEFTAHKWAVAAYEMADAMLAAR